MAIVNEDFKTLPNDICKDYSIRKQILWESETATEEEFSSKEVEFSRKHGSNNPRKGYNRWPKFNVNT